ncbi:MAG TPA: hypothetical protein VMA34_06845 [Terracidiphilus sp.]|nr:hypothetical protein [Terracidiphilus sp.]
MPLSTLGPAAKVVVPVIAGLALAGAGVGYAVHEHSGAQDLAAQNQQVTAELSTTESQVNLLTAKVAALQASAQASAQAAAAAKPSPDVYTARAQAERRRAERRAIAARDARFDKLQTQVDAQGREIDQTRSDLTSTSTALSGSIARNHGQLVALEKKGERNYYEFDIVKSREFKREGPLSVRLKKANERHQFADLMLIVDDRNLTEKHVNLYQPVMFYEPNSQTPLEVVINDISKNHIHGYISAPKYSPSDLAAMASAGSDSGDAQASNAAPAREKLPVPPPPPNQ